MHGQIVSFHKHSFFQIEELLGLAVMAKLLAIGMSFWPEAKPTFGHWFEWLKWDGRLLVTSTLSKTCGWLLNFVVCWIVFRFSSRNDPDQSVQVRTLVGLVCSYLSFLVILLLNVVSDGETIQGSEAVVSFGLMTGFAWRRCFGLTINLVTSNIVQKADFLVSDSKQTSLILNACMCLLFAPPHTCIYFVVIS